MMEFLEQLRKKPAHIRTRFAFGGAFAVTALIALVWSTTLPTRFGEIGGTIAEKSAEQSATVQNGFDALIQQTSETFAVPEESEAVTEEEPALPDRFETSAMNDLGGWGEDSETARAEESEPIPTPQKETDTTSNPSEEVEPEQKVILIGTSTKKDE